MFGGVGSLGTGPVAQLVGVVNTSSGGRTKSFVDEMGVFGCPDMADWDSVRDTSPHFFNVYSSLRCVSVQIACNLFI